MGDESFRYFQKEPEDFHRKIANLMSTISVPKGFDDNLSILYQAMKIPSFEDSKPIHSSQNDQQDIARQKIAKYKGANSILLRSFYYLINLHSDFAPASFEIFSNHLPHYALKANTNEDVHIIPQEFLEDLWRFLEPMKIAELGTISAMKSRLGSVLTGRRRNADLGPKPKSFFECYKEKDIQEVTFLLLMFFLD